MKSKAVERQRQTARALIRAAGLKPSDLFLRPDGEATYKAVLLSRLGPAARPRLGLRTAGVPRDRG